LTPSTSPATTVLTVSTLATASAASHNPVQLIPGTTLAVALCFLGFGKRRRIRILVMIAVTTLGLTALNGCSKGLTSPNSGGSTSTVTVTATAGSIQRSTTFSLTVQ
jgi:hypothetical protein